MSNFFNWPGDFISLVPELIVLLAAFFLIFFEPLLRESGRKLVFFLSILTLLLSGTGVFIFIRGDVGPLDLFNETLVLDRFGLFFKIIFLAAGLLTMLASQKMLNDLGIGNREYFPLLLISIAGLMLMVSSKNLLTIWIALETAVLPIFVLTGYIRKEKRSSEAAFKYFILAAFSSAVYVYGVSLIYGATGRIDLEGLAGIMVSGELTPVFVLGMILIAVAISFEMAAVPFHNWAPDTFEGAPTPITAFLSTAPKAGAFAIFMRIFFEGFGNFTDEWKILLIFLSIASMTYGNITAVLQENIKRMLAYSSIAHAGYILLGIVAATERADVFAFRSVLIYVFAYTFMNIGAFNLIMLIKRSDTAGELLEDFSGLAGKSHFAAFSMLVFMLGLTGIPFTSGFIGKFYVFGAAVKTGYGWLAVIAVVNSVISLFYYMRVVVYMYLKKPFEDCTYAPSFLLGFSVVLSFTVTFLMVFFLSPLNDWAARSVLIL